MTKDNLETIMSEFDEKFVITNDEKWVVVNKYKVKDYFISSLQKVIKAEREKIKDNINIVKDMNAQMCGTHKYDDCYEDCIDVINNLDK